MNSWDYIIYYSKWILIIIIWNSQIDDIRERSSMICIFVLALQRHLSTQSYFHWMLKPVSKPPSYWCNLSRWSFDPKFFGIVDVAWCWLGLLYMGTLKSKFHREKLKWLTLWLFNIAMEHGPFNYGLPLKRSMQGICIGMEYSSKPAKTKVTL